MNTEFENEPTDEQLDAMLRDVQIPADLKSRLMGIPELESVVEQSSASPQATLPAVSPADAKSTPWLSCVLVASLLAVAGFTAAQFLPKDNGNNAPGSIASTNVKDPEKKIDLSPENPAINNSIVESDIDEQEIQMLQAQIQALEIARLESELLQLEKNIDEHLDENEVASMILALAPEYSVPLGGNESDVRSEMARVLKEYPNTRGAVLADKMLKQFDESNQSTN